MAKSDRLLAVLWLLHVRRKLTARELAGALEVDVRTVYRDIQSLSMAGVPVIAEPGPGGGYRLADDFTAAPLYFAPDEARELFVAAHLARATRPDRLSDSTSRARHQPGGHGHVQRHGRGGERRPRPVGGHRSPARKPGRPLRDMDLLLPRRAAGHDDAGVDAQPPPPRALATLTGREVRALD
ncbi:MAG: HTH domain-containing protein [Firmicutes bacterium]|nr:HTH domain-containing protein [Bacillota bacterium]